MQDKNTSTRLCAKNVGGGGGLMCEGGVFVGHYGTSTSKWCQLFH